MKSRICCCHDWRVGRQELFGRRLRGRNSLQRHLHQFRGPLGRQNRWSAAAVTEVRAIDEALTALGAEHGRGSRSGKSSARIVPRVGFHINARDWMPRFETIYFGAVGGPVERPPNATRRLVLPSGGRGPLSQQRSSSWRWPRMLALTSHYPTAPIAACPRDEKGGPAGDFAAFSILRWVWDLRLKPTCQRKGRR